MNNLKLLNSIIKGFLTFVPGISSLIKKKHKKSKHSCSNATFCYELWLSLLVYFNENGIKPNLDIIGEFGNGSSIGVGLCALLSGSKEYYAFEIDVLFDKELNLNLLDDIILLFKRRAQISNRFEQLNLRINDFSYPENLIKPFFGDNGFVSEIKYDLENNCINSKRIKLVKPCEIKRSENIDFIFTRAVMEHVADPDSVYKEIFSQLKVNSYMFHDIEFHSHGITNGLYAHLDIPDILWKVIYGRKEYYLNRWSLQKHILSIVSNNFNIIKIQKTIKIEVSQNIHSLYGATILAKKVSE